MEVCLILVKFFILWFQCIRGVEHDLTLIKSYSMSQSIIPYSTSLDTEQSFTTVENP